MISIELGIVPDIHHCRVKVRDLAMQPAGEGQGGGEPCALRSVHPPRLWPSSTMITFPGSWSPRESRVLDTSSELYGASTTSASGSARRAA